MAQSAGLPAHGLFEASVDPRTQGAAEALVSWRSQAPLPPLASTSAQVLSMPALPSAEVGENNEDESDGVWEPDGDERPKKRKRRTNGTGSRRAPKRQMQTDEADDESSDGSASPLRVDASAVADAIAALSGKAFSIKDLNSIDQAQWQNMPTRRSRGRQPGVRKELGPTTVQSPSPPAISKSPPLFAPSPTNFQERSEALAIFTSQMKALGYDGQDVALMYSFMSKQGYDKTAPPIASTSEAPPPTHVIDEVAEPIRVDGKGKKLFACLVPGCGKVFKRGEHLKRHVRSLHTDEKPYACPFDGCEKSFNRVDNLHQHTRVHGTDGSASSIVRVRQQLGQID